MFQLLRYIRPFRKDYLLATLYSLVNKFLDIMPEILLGIAINTVVEKESSWLASLGVRDLGTQLLLLGLLTLIVYALESLFEYLKSIKWWRLAQDVQHKFRIAAFSHVQHSTLYALDQKKTGNLLSILNDDINQLERFLEEGVDTIIELVATVLFVGGIFFTLSSKIALLTLLPIPCVVYGTYILQDKLSLRYLAIREKAGILSAYLANSLLGLSSIKRLVGEKIEVAHFTRLSEAYRSANFDAIRWAAFVAPITRFAILFGYLVTLVYGGLLTISGQLDVGAYGVLIFLTQRLLWPFMDLAETIINFQRVMSSTARLLQLFQMPFEASPTVSFPLQGKIECSRVSFAYPQHTPTFMQLSFTIMPGQTVAFVGPTGAGKSTLFKLLLGLHTPTSGEIFFDAHALTTLSLTALRKQIGFVDGDPFFFEGTVAENIGYACAHVTQEQIIQAAHHAFAHEFIMRLPEGYDTRLGERGKALSSGQKQRIALARALVRNPSILLLDEATSAVDNETELIIQQSLSSISQGKTTLFIAHRLVTAKQADHIFVLKSGAIVEQGNHTSLLQQEGLYANLWRLQTG